MIQPRHYLWLSLLLMQSGCALHTSYVKMEPQIDQWLKSKQYDNALDALGSVDPKDPQYQKAAEKRREVEALAANYEQDIRAQTRSYLDQGQWEKALDTFDEALNRLPQSAVLKDGLAQLHHEQQEELERLEFERLMAHGEWLKQTLPTYRSIARVDPRSRNARLQMDRMQREAEDVASELALFGNKALANNDLSSADKTLTLAAELSDALAIEESLKKLHQQQKQRNAKIRAKKEQREKQQRDAEQAKANKVSRHLGAYKTAFKKKDFQRARTELDTLKRIDSRNREWGRLEKELDQATSREAERLFDSGVSAYSRGNFEQAAKRWREVLKLKPDHKPAQENLERAERVLEKLQELKQKQSN